MISIIIVNFNTADFLKQCIESVIKIEGTSDIEIIIVDNFSNDNSRYLINSLSEKYVNINPVFLNEQMSFAHANNTGFLSSRGEYILIMNPDIIFNQPILRKLKEHLESRPEVGAVCAALIGADGKFQSNYFQRYPSLSQFIFFYSILSKFFNKYKSIKNKYLENLDIYLTEQKLYYVEQIPFAFFLTRRDIFKNNRMIDENYFLFFEDVDTSYKIAKNFKLLLDTDLKVIHIGGSSLNIEDNWWLYGKVIISMNYFFDKHYSILRAFLLKSFTVINSIMILLWEYLKKFFRKSDAFRIKKHKYYLKLFKEKYL